MSDQNTQILELEITQEDIDKSIERRKKRGADITRCCVISTAAQRQLNNKRIESAFGSLWFNNQEFKGDNDLEEFMVAFDSRNYSSLKPRKFILTLIERTPSVEQN